MRAWLEGLLWSVVLGWIAAVVFAVASVLLLTMTELPETAKELAPEADLGM